MNGKRRRISIAYLVDTWVWMEYWKSGSHDAKEIIESGEDLFISAITIAEVAQQYASSGENAVGQRVTDMLTRSTGIPLDQTIAVMAGVLRHREIHGGMADAIILATARIHDLTLVTGDQHFRDIPGVRFIGHTG